MKRTKLIKLAGVFVLLAAIGVIAWILVSGFLNRPLAPPLELIAPEESPTQAAPPPQSVTPGQSGQSDQTDKPDPSSQEAPEVKPAEEVQAPATTVNTQGMCGMTGKMTLLASGISFPSKRGKQDVGAIRLVGVDFDAGKIMVLALPPKMWVATPALANQGIQATELRKVFLLAREAAKGVESRPNFKATQVFAQTLADNFSYFPNHYATVDPEVFVEIVDEYGGLDIRVPEYLDASVEDYGIFEAGLEHMDGTRALDYVSMVKPNGAHSPDEWARLERQNQVVRAMLKTAIKLENLPKLPKLIEMFHRLVTTDLSINQLRSLACMVTEMGVGVDLVEFSPDLVSLDAQGNMLPEKEKIKELIQSLTAGQ